VGGEGPLAACDIESKGRRRSAVPSIETQIRRPDRANRMRLESTGGAARVVAERIDSVAGFATFDRSRFLKKDGGALPFLRRLHA